MKKSIGKRVRVNDKWIRKNAAVVGKCLCGVPAQITKMFDGKIVHLCMDCADFSPTCKVCK